MTKDPNEVAPYRVDRRYRHYEVFDVKACEPVATVFDYEIAEKMTRALNGEPLTPPEPSYVGYTLKKTGGDYEFEGVVVADFKKTGGERRLVAENAQKLLFIFNPAQVKLTPPDGGPGG